MVALGEVLSHRKEFIEIDDFATYKRCRVQLHAQGIVLRDQVTGTEIKTKKQQGCKAGDFLVAEIDAKVGGYGIVPQHLEGAIVSSHYFLFEVNQARLERPFLGYFIRTPAFFEQVAAQGSTNYAAIRPAHVLQYQIPLPPSPSSSVWWSGSMPWRRRLRRRRGFNYKSMMGLISFAGLLFVRTRMAQSVRRQ
jgi:type I restriction enzyme S subunit